MKKKVLLIGIALMSMTLQPFDTDARGRNNVGTGNSTRPAQNASGRQRPGNSGNSGTQRPGNSGNNGTQRPGNSGNSGTQRPGNSGNNGTQRPGNSGNSGTQRPGNSGNSGTQRPGNSGTQRPSGDRPSNNRPGSNQPGNNRPSGNRPSGNRPGSNVPSRPHTPPHYNHYRPTPPPSWRPSGNMPNFGSILCVNLGWTIANSINALINNNYNIAGYTDDCIYLTNISMFNQIWPNVTLYYDNGYLDCSLFSFASNIYDPARYYYVMNTLTNTYGAPISTQTLSGNGMCATWWGYNNTYIRLSFYPEYVPGTGTRYFTTLSLGN